MALPYNAQSAPVGPTTGTITINSVSYVVDGYTYENTSQRGRRTDFEGTSNANWLWDQDIRGTMTLQLAASSTALPPVGQTGSYDFHGGSAITIVVESCSLPVQKGEDRKVTINWFKAAA